MALGGKGIINVMLNFCTSIVDRDSTVTTHSGVKRYFFPLSQCEACESHPNSFFVF